MFDEWIIEWDIQKNRKLQEVRNVSFEQVEVLIQEGNILDIIPHPSKQYRHQSIIIVCINEYIYLVPFVVSEKDKRIFFKTIIPSRKYTKIYLQYN